jgi:AhpD family alkylhydroperoxidase
MALTVRPHLAGAAAREVVMAQQIEFTGDNTPTAIVQALSGATDGPRSAIFKDIEATLGIVPEFFKLMPSTHLEAEWNIFKNFQLSDKTVLDPKTKELIGLAAAATLHCKYCTYFHTVAAGMNGATAQEINEALLMTKQTSGWSNYLTGARYDLEQLKREMAAIKRHMEKAKARH